MINLETTNLIYYAFLISMFTNAVNVCFWEGHIFQKAGDYMEANYPTLWKPIAGCIICMVPYWGAAICLLMGWPVLCIPVAMGMNVLIVRWEPEKD